MSKELKILITNDDGVYAEGIRCLWEALRTFASVTVVAPLSEMSATSCSLTTRSPLQPRRMDWEGLPVWAVDGTPADCVKLACRELLEGTPDLVLSGINHGSNAGRNLLYSGTVGAAIEGALRGLPSIAFSSTGFVHPNFELAIPHIPSIVNYVVDHPLPRGTLLNVNFPSEVKGGLKGIKMAHQGRMYWVEDPRKGEHPHGSTYYWLGGQLSECEESEGSDVHCLMDGYAAAVPIYVDELTHHQELAQRRQGFESYVQNFASES
jgi:5'-nucleotidase